MLAPDAPDDNRTESPLGRRLLRLPRREIADRSVPIAIDPLSRLLGLAGLSRERAGAGLLLPGCRSVHTWGMRFHLDLYFFAADGTVLRAVRDLAPRRFAAERRASCVLELPSERIAPGDRGPEPRTDTDQEESDAA